jgi:hypothetical protein
MQAIVSINFSLSNDERLHNIPNTSIIQFKLLGSDNKRLL